MALACLLKLLTETIIEDKLTLLESNIPSLPYI